jgi:hypothetical protein
LSPPLYDLVRGDPRFDNLLQRIGIAGMAAAA